jgi:DNA-binding transcriptional regulator GbsR (MarR family)
MKLEEAKEKFVNAWGTLGSNWGINRTMAQVHALLLVSSNPMSAEDIMAELNISRGNANMTVRELINWGLVFRVNLKGERKEFFEAEKDIYKVGKRVLAERKKRELDPIFKILAEVKTIDENKKDPEVKAFTDRISEINGLVNKADTFANIIIKSDEHWFMNSLLKMMK